MDLLKRIDTWVSKKKDEGDGDRPKWWVAPVVVLVTLLGLALGAWVLSRHSRELARLRHEEFKRELSLKLEKRRLLVASSEAERDASLQRVSDLRESADAIDLVIESAKEAYEKDLARIERLGWDAVGRQRGGR